MEFTKKNFGILPTGEEVLLYTLRVGDLSLSLSSFGASWTSLIIPSQNQGEDDILLGYPSFIDWVNNSNYFGVTVGRFANRIDNGEFSINGKRYFTDKNNKKYTLHGGPLGFSKRNWESEVYKDGDGLFVRFELFSRDGDQGFPGNLNATVIVGLTQSNKLVVTYSAEVDAPSPINLTNHTYFNLAGEGKNNILNHQLQLNSSAYVEVDDFFIPTGETPPVAGTLLDFRTPKAIGEDISALSDSPIGGYDHCFVVDGKIGELRPFGELKDPLSGRVMRGFTTQPGVQVYTGNMLKSVVGKSGTTYKKNWGICLETQHFPDSPNQSNFPSAIFSPERKYLEKTLFEFDW